MKTIVNRDHVLLGLRLVVAAIFVWHGYPKVSSPEGVIGFFGGLGLPGWLGPVVGVVEIVAGAALAVGFKHRWACAPLLVIIIGALVLVQIPRGITASLERELLILVSLLVLMAESRLGFSLAGGSDAG